MSVSSPKRKSKEEIEDKDKKSMKMSSPEQGKSAAVRGPIDFGEGKYSVGNNWLRTLVRHRAESFGVDGQPQKLPIFVAERTDKIVDVFKGMSDRNITAVPVLLRDERSFFGYLELADIVRYIVEHFGPRGEKEQDFWQLLRQESDFKDRTVNDMMKYPLQRKTQFLSVIRGYTAWAVFEPLGREPHVHRLAVIDRDSRQLYNLVTQGMVIRFIYDHIDKIGGVKNKPICEVDGTICKVVTVKDTSKTIDAFNHMVTKDIGAIAVVNDEDKLIGAISLRDIRMVSTDLRFFWRLQQSVGDYLTKMHEDWNVRHGRPARVVCITPNDTLEEAVKTLYGERLHTLFIVNNREEKKPVGVVNVKMIAKELVTVND
jgi:CBS domain-containing protein